MGSQCRDARITEDLKVGGELVENLEVLEMCVQFDRGDAGEVAPGRVRINMSDLTEHGDTHCTRCRAGLCHKRASNTAEECRRHHTST